MASLAQTIFKFALNLDLGSPKCSHGDRFRMSTAVHYSPRQFSYVNVKSLMQTCFCVLYLQGASVMMKDLPVPLKWFISGAFTTFGQEAFINRTVKDLLWGYNEPFLDFVNAILPGKLPFKGKFGLFADVSEMTLVFRQT